MDQPLATLSENGTPPKSRIGSARDATEYAFNLLDADQSRAIQRTRYKGLIDGNAPYNKRELISKGMSDRTNLNFRQANAIINQFKSPYYDLLTEVPYLADIETSAGNSEERADWNQVMIEEFDRLVKQWSNWDFFAQYSQYQMLLYGICHAYWHDAMDWRPDVGKCSEVLFPDESPSNLDEVEGVVIRKAYASHKLYNFVRNPEYAKQMGWNVDEVYKTIRASYRGTQPPDNTSQVEWLQQKLHNSDLYFGTYECNRVYTGHVLVKEFNQKVSHHIVRMDQRSTNYLFSQVDRFDSLQAVLCPFFYDIGDGTVHSIHGLGYEIYPYCEVFNRLRCREVDAAQIAASVLLQQQDSQSVQASQMLTIDNLKILPPGLKFLEHQIGQNIQATIDVRRDMEGGMINNIGGLLKAPGGPNPRKGQKQALAEMQQAAQLGKGNINRYYTALDALYWQMFKKASNPGISARDPGGKQALEFQRRCFKRGVPPEAFEELDSVKAYRSIGAGSAANALMITEALMEVASSLPEEGKQEALRLYISRLAGSRTANALLGDVQTKDRQTSEDSIAQLENNAMRQGQPVIITNMQNHVIHAKSHLKDAFAHLQELDQIAQQKELEVADMQPVYVHLETAGPHVYQHLEKFKDDGIRAKDHKELSAQWNQLSQMANQVKKNLEQMMQAEQEKAAQQQQQPQPNAEMLKNLPYDKAPESVRMQIEAAAGTPRQPGEVSTAGQNMQVKEATLQLKAGKEQRNAATDDVRLSREIQNDNKPNQ